MKWACDQLKGSAAYLQSGGTLPGVQACRGHHKTKAVVEMSSVDRRSFSWVDVEDGAYRYPTQADRRDHTGPSKWLW